MSDVFEGYERQYSELSANLTKKCTVAGALDRGPIPILSYLVSSFCTCDFYM